jgi:hypothetical protein
LSFMLFPFTHNIRSLTITRAGQCLIVGHVGSAVVTRKAQRP